MAPSKALVSGLFSRSGPAWLGLALGAAALLAVGGRSLATAGRAGPWLFVWSVAGLVVFLFGMRRSGLSAPGLLRGAAWLAAGGLGAALLGRHSIEGLVRAAAEAAWSTPLFGPVDLADLTFLLVLLAALFAAGAGKPRQSGSSLAAPAIVVVTGLLVLVAVSGRRDLVASAMPAAGDLSLPLVVVVGSTAWMGVLAGLGSVPPGGGMIHRLSGVLAVSLALVVGSRWLLSVHGEAALLRSDGVLLARPGLAAFGPWGDRIGAGLEGLVCLFAAVAVLVITGRIAARDLPGLDSAALPLLGVVVALTVAVLPLVVLVPAAGVVGWVAVLLGVEPEVRGGVS